MLRNSFKIVLFSLWTFKNYTENTGEKVVQSLMFLIIIFESCLYVSNRLLWLWCHMTLRKCWVPNETGMIQHIVAGKRMPAECNWNESTFNTGFLLHSNLPGAIHLVRNVNFQQNFPLISRYAMISKKQDKANAHSVETLFLVSSALQAALLDVLWTMSTFLRKTHRSLSEVDRKMQMVAITIIITNTRLFTREKNPILKEIANLLCFARTDSKWIACNLGGTVNKSAFSFTKNLEVQYMSWNTFFI